MKCHALTAAIALPLILLSGTFATGGIVPLSRTSTLHVAGVAGADEFNTFRTTDGLVDTRDSLSGVALDVTGTTARSTASHDSVVQTFSAGDRLKASARGTGNVFAMFSPQDNSGPLVVDATSDYRLSFRVTERNANFGAVGTFDGALSSAAVSLMETSDPSHPRPIYSFVNEEPFELQFDVDRTLEPGTYTFSARAFAASSGGSGTESRFSTFDTTIMVDQRIHPIPLPPAVWTGLAGLILTAAGSAWFKRKRFVNQ